MYLVGTRFNRYALLAMGWLWAILPTHAETWTIRADHWCPYNCTPGTDRPGYMIEILQRTAAKHGHTLDYRLMPWPRALQQAREGLITGVVGMVASNREGLLLSDKMGVDATCVFVLKGSTLRYRRVSDLDSFGRIGIVEGYGYPDEFMQWQKRHARQVQAVAGENTLQMQAKKLTSQRIEAFVENVNVVRHSESEVPELRWVGNAGCMQEEDLYFGYSKKVPHAASIKQMVDQELAAMKKNGELNKLLEKYRVAPW
ncbi:transporter substrate-binding domain-containing protein [Curvibacter sp. APW13]|uniref:substrate-binding periplasmic protein n=1 Tax=Curvibacter sp. APW13 TaxID=3077236 RepID=UPI0028DDB80F|nr:transporter substrate-binding domain-containing protein [Curvibacter sp. APW13]MDT8989459.1 transporter substrate-binding domain-containing protein [Curvibacter sp. APW13]